MCLLVGYKPGFVDQGKNDRAFLLGLLISVTRNLSLPQNLERFSAWREEGRAALRNKKEMALKRLLDEAPNEK